jgi:hypothetical protein
MFLMTVHRSGVWLFLAPYLWKAGALLKGDYPGSTTGDSS